MTGLDCTLPTDLPAVLPPPTCTATTEFEAVLLPDPVTAVGADASTVTGPALAFTVGVTSVFPT